MKDRLHPPAALTEDVVYRQILITVPSNADIERFLWGAVFGISFLTAWHEDSSGMSGEEAAGYIKAILASRMEFNMLGTIQAVTRETLHSSMLLCDGSVYNKVDYPQLWEVLPSAMKDATTLTLPDLSEKFLFGTSMDYLVGDVGGTAEETLTVDQIPAHAHGYEQYTFGIDIESVGVPDPTGVGQPLLPQVTDDTGGGEAHNNLPPFFVVAYAMIAKVTP